VDGAAAAAGGNDDSDFAPSPLTPSVHKKRVVTCTNCGQSGHTS
jgi:hypothetical protein